MNTTIAPVHRAPKRFARRLPLIAGSVLLAGLVGGGVAVAYWQSIDASNPAGARADSLPQGATPTASLTDATTVAVTFARAATTSGRDVTSYTIRRYDAATSTSPSATFTCSWPSGSSLGCSEAGVPGGTWYYTDTPAIAGSQWTGAESAKSSAVTNDVTAPTVVVTSITPTPNSHGYNNSSPVTVNLSATDGTGGSGVATITYRVDSAAPVTVHSSTAAVPVSGDGTHNVSYSATDNAGNTSTPQSQTITIDTGSPALSGLAVPTWINLANKAAVPVSGSINESNASTITIVATDHNGATVTKTVTISSGATSWNTTLDLNALADGTVNYSVTALDDAGNSSSPALTASSVKDTVAPDAPTAVAISNGGGASNSYINGTNAASVSYDVTIPSGANNSTADTVTVALTSGATVSGTKSPSNPGGTVTVSGINAGSLNDATVAVSATVTDQAGNASAAKTGTTPKDTVAPDAPTAVAISNGGGAGNAYINSANASSVNYNVAIPSGTRNSTTDTVRVALTSGGTVSGATASSPGGTATVSAINATSLTDGTVSVSAATTDLAGNASAPKTGTTIKDTVAPDAPTAVAISNGGGAGNAYINSTNASSVNYNVTIPSGSNNSAADTVRVALAGGAVSGTTTSNPGNSVTVSAINASSLTDGTVPLSATVTDPAGNGSSAKTGTTTKDTVAPEAPTTVAISNGGGTGNAYINSLNASSVNYNVAIPSGPRNSTNDTVRVTLTSGATATGTTTSNPGTTVTVSAINATSLTDGTVSVSATATDQAGNVSAAATATTPKETVSPTGTLNTNQNKYSYTDNSGQTPDKIGGTNGAITSWGSDSSLAVVAVEQTGPHPGNRYSGAQVASGGNGSFTAFNVDSATSGTVKYDLYLMDTAGNLTTKLATLTFTASS